MLKTTTTGSISTRGLLDFYSRATRILLASCYGPTSTLLGKTARKQSNSTITQNEEEFPHP
jgi:hypothetical protein